MACLAVIAVVAAGCGDDSVEALPKEDYVAQGNAICAAINEVVDPLFEEFFTTAFKSKRYELSWQNQYNTGQNSQLSFGLDYYRENGESQDAWDESRNNTGLFASYDHFFNRLHLQLGGRYDDNSRFGNKFTGQAALGYDIGEDWQIRGSYGSA